MSDVNINTPVISLKSLTQSGRQSTAAPDLSGSGAPADFPAGGSSPAASSGASSGATNAKSDAGKKLDQAVVHLNDHMQSLQREIRFQVDRKTGKVVVKVIDQKTHQVLQQIPDEVAIRLARTLHQSEPISLLKTKV